MSQLYNHQILFQDIHVSDKRIHVQNLKAINCSGDLSVSETLGKNMQIDGFTAQEENFGF
jgi:hypothetical protein